VANTHKKRPEFCQGVDSTEGKASFTRDAENARMVPQVVFDEAGDEVVAVVVAGLQTQRQRMPAARGLAQRFRLELVGQEVVASPWSTSIGRRSVAWRSSSQASQARQAAVVAQVAGEGLWPQGQSIGWLIGAKADTDGSGRGCKAQTSAPWPPMEWPLMPRREDAGKCASISAGSRTT
jgi:hypothetical protein